MKENKESFSRIKLMPRVLRSVSTIDLSTSVLGTHIDIPICVSPTAFQSMAHPEGAVATAKATAFHNTCMVLNGAPYKTMEEIASEVPIGLRWQNVYILKRRDITKGMVERAERVGSKAIVVSVDNPTIGNRYDMKRIKEFSSFPKLKFANYLQYFEENATTASIHEEIKHGDPSATWEDIAWLKSITKLPIVLKGIMSTEDAVIAVQHGIDAILVSNHGGRQLDTVPSTIEVLPEIVQAVGDKVEIYVDGGVRMGTDVLKALALGAKAVFIGRPVIYGLAYKGEDGVKDVLEILKDELKNAMTLTGCRSISDIKPSILYKNSLWHD
ncbi:2-Hydroxyacid oxidase 1-like [Glandiceps talaboti]